MLSEAREDMSTTVIGNKVIFAGGQSSSIPAVTTIDIYDNETTEMATLQLSKASRYGVIARAAGEQLLLAIPGDSVYETTVDIFSLVNCK